MVTQKNGKRIEAKITIIRMVSYLYFGKVSPHICDFIHECAANWIYGRIKNYIEFNKTIDELNRA